jgi:hypothetical protein
MKKLPANFSAKVYPGKKVPIPSKAKAAEYDLWDNNEIQFARLLCELVANCDNLEFDAVCASMDLSKRELMSLYDRANLVWEKSKRDNCR